MRLILLTFISSTLFAQDLAWDRENSCPVGDMAFVEKVLSEMTVEEKVGQTIMACLLYTSPSPRDS